MYACRPITDICELCACGALDTPLPSRCCDEVGAKL